MVRQRGPKHYRERQFSSSLHCIVSLFPHNLQKSIWLDGPSKSNEPLATWARRAGRLGLSWPSIFGTLILNDIGWAVFYFLFFRPFSRARLYFVLWARGTLGVKEKKRKSRQRKLLLGCVNVRMRMNECFFGVRMYEGKK